MSHFRIDEFQCKCGCGENLISPNLMLILEMIREDVQYPMVVTSGFRCRLHNTNVGGHVNSSHCVGMAADIRCSGLLAARIISFALLRGINGIGVSQKGDWNSRFVHLDIAHEDFKIWSY